MNDEYVMDNLRKRLNARVQGHQDKTGRWFLNLKQTFAYVPPIPPRTMVNFTNPVRSLFDNDPMPVPVDIYVEISVEVEKYTMRYSFELVIRNLRDMLNRRYKELVGQQFPLSQKRGWSVDDLKKFWQDTPPDLFRQQLYGRFIMNPADRANLMRGERPLPDGFGNHVGDFHGMPVFESSYIKQGTIYFQPHEEKAWDRGFRFDRELPPEFEGFRQQLGKRIGELSNRMFFHGYGGYPRYTTSYLVGEGGSGRSGKEPDPDLQIRLNKLVRKFNPNWSQEWDEWRYRDDYEWNWVGRGLMWLKRKLLSLKT